MVSRATDGSCPISAVELVQIAGDSSMIGLQDRKALAGGCPSDAGDKDEQRKDASHGASLVASFVPPQGWCCPRLAGQRAAL